MISNQVCSSNYEGCDHLALTDIHSHGLSELSAS